MNENYLTNRARSNASIGDCPSTSICLSSFAPSPWPQKNKSDCKGEMGKKELCVVMSSSHYDNWGFILNRFLLSPFLSPFCEKSNISPSITLMKNEGKPSVFFISLNVCLNQTLLAVFRLSNYSPLHHKISHYFQFVTKILQKMYFTPVEVKIVTKTLQLHQKCGIKSVTLFSYLLYKDYYFVTKT